MTPPTDLRDRALSLHRRLPVSDLHSHALLGMSYLGFEVTRPRPPFRSWNPLRNLFDLVDVPRAREGGVQVLVFVSYVLPTPWRGYLAATLEQFRRFHRYLEKHKDVAEFARTASDVERIRAAGKTACMLAVEGGHILEGDLSRLETLRDEGIVYLTLTHFIDNEISASATHTDIFKGGKNGLTALGREAVLECNRLSILCDVTHSSHRAKQESARLSRQPIIYSHTGLKRFVNAERMTTDDELRMVRDTGGLVGLLLSPYFLSGGRKGGADSIVANLAHMIETIGEDHTAIGSDFDSGLPPPTGLRDMRDYPEITVEMVRAGLPERTIAKAWGENFLRVLRAIGR